MDISKPLNLFCVLASLCCVPCHSKKLHTTPPPPYSEMIKINCLQLTGFKPLNSNYSFYRVMEVVNNRTALLPCSYCGAEDEDVPRKWTRKRRVVSATLDEVDLGVNADLEENRIFTYPNHTLVIQNVTIADAGEYFCQSPMEKHYEFTFSLDVIAPDVPVVTADKGSWEKYNSKTMTAANENIYRSHDKELEALLDKIKVKVVSEWDPWLPCDGCSGVRRRFAKCRVRPSLNTAKYPNVTDLNLTSSQQIFVDSNVLSCHSLDLAVLFPYLTSLTGVLPDYLKTQQCYDECFKPKHKTLEAKYFLDINMEFGSSMSFVCPDSDLMSSVFWKHDGIAIKTVDYMTSMEIEKNTASKGRPKFKLPHVFIDHMHILQLCLVGSEQSGEYVCYVEGNIMKVIRVTVITSEETMHQRYYHFLLLFIYTFCVSASIVSVGIGWGIYNRHLFNPTVGENVKPAVVTVREDTSHDIQVVTIVR